MLAIMPDAEASTHPLHSFQIRPACVLLAARESYGIYPGAGAVALIRKCPRVRAAEPGRLLKKDLRSHALVRQIHDDHEPGRQRRPRLFYFLVAVDRVTAARTHAFFMSAQGAVLSHEQTNTGQIKCAILLCCVDMRRLCAPWGCRSGSAPGLHPAGPLLQ